MAAAAGGMRAQLEALAAEYQAIGKESQKAAKASQTFSSQLTENEMVRKGACATPPPARGERPCAVPGRQKPRSRRRARRPHADHLPDPSPHTHPRPPVRTSRRPSIAAHPPLATSIAPELDMVEEDANVYKLIGPALIKQDVTEAKANVDKRIEYITTELNRYEKSIKSLDKKQDEKREEIMKLQAEFQKQQAATADLN